MHDLKGYELEIKDSKLQENVISDNYTKKIYNLKALKNLYIQDLRTNKRRSSGFVTGAIIGGMIDGSVGDDTIIDGAIIGGLLGSTTSTYVSGNIYATLQFFDNMTLNVQIDDDSELMRLQEFAIKNHTIENSQLEKSLEIVHIDKKIFNSTLIAARIYSLIVIAVGVAIGSINHFIEFDIVKDNSPMSEAASLMASPFILGILSILIITFGVKMFFSVGGQTVILKDKKAN